MITLTDEGKKNYKNLTHIHKTFPSKLGTEETS